MEDGRDGLVLDLISRAALAGANSAMARECPGAAVFFERKADEHSRRVTALADELAERVLARPRSH